MRRCAGFALSRHPRLKGNLAKASTVDVFTEAGTATPRKDYWDIADTLEFGATEHAATFSVELIDDNKAEPDETVALTLSNPVGANLGATPSATLFINGDDGLVRPLSIRDSVMVSGPNWTITEAIPWLSLSATVLVQREDDRVAVL